MESILDGSNNATSASTSISTSAVTATLNDPNLSAKRLDLSESQIEELVQRDVDRRYVYPPGSHFANGTKKSVVRTIMRKIRENRNNYAFNTVVNILNKEKIGYEKNGRDSRDVNCNFDYTSTTADSKLYIGDRRSIRARRPPVCHKEYIVEQQIVVPKAKAGETGVHSCNAITNTNKNIEKSYIVPRVNRNEIIASYSRNVSNSNTSKNMCCSFAAEARLGDVSRAAAALNHCDRFINNRTGIDNQNINHCNGSMLGKRKCLNNQPGTNDMIDNDNVTAVSPCTIRYKSTTQTLLGLPPRAAPRLSSTSRCSPLFGKIYGIVRRVIPSVSRYRITADDIGSVVEAVIRLLYMGSFRKARNEDGDAKKVWSVNATVTRKRLHRKLMQIVAGTFIRRRITNLRKICILSEIISTDYNYHCSCVSRASIGHKNKGISNSSSVLESHAFTDTTTAEQKIEKLKLNLIPTQNNEPFNMELDKSCASNPILSPPSASRLPASSEIAGNASRITSPPNIASLSSPTPPTRGKIDPDSYSIYLKDLIMFELESRVKITDKQCHARERQNLLRRCILAKLNAMIANIIEDAQNIGANISGNTSVPAYCNSNSNITNTTKRDSSNNCGDINSTKFGEKMQSNTEAAATRDSIVCEDISHDNSSSSVVIVDSRESVTRANVIEKFRKKVKEDRIRKIVNICLDKMQRGKEGEEQLSRDIDKLVGDICNFGTTDSAQAQHLFTCKLVRTRVRVHDIAIEAIKTVGEGGRKELCAFIRSVVNDLYRETGSYALYSKPSLRKMIRQKVAMIRREGMNDSSSVNSSEIMGASRGNSSSGYPFPNVYKSNIDSSLSCREIKNNEKRNTCNAYTTRMKVAYQNDGGVFTRRTGKTNYVPKRKNVSNTSINRMHCNISTKETAKKISKIAIIAKRVTVLTNERKGKRLALLVGKEVDKMYGEFSGASAVARREFLVSCVIRRLRRNGLPEAELESRRKVKTNCDYYYKKKSATSYYWINDNYTPPNNIDSSISSKAILSFDSNITNRLRYRKECILGNAPECSGEKMRGNENSDVGTKSREIKRYQRITGKPVVSKKRHTSKIKLIDSGRNIYNNTSINRINNKYNKAMYNYSNDSKQLWTRTRSVPVSLSSPLLVRGNHPEGIEKGNRKGDGFCSNSGSNKTNKRKHDNIEHLCDDWNSLWLSTGYKDYYCSASYVSHIAQQLFNQNQNNTYYYNITFIIKLLFYFVNQGITCYCCCTESRSGNNKVSNQNLVNNKVSNQNLVNNKVSSNNRVDGIAAASIASAPLTTPSCLNDYRLFDSGKEPPAPLTLSSRYGNKYLMELCHGSNSCTSYLLRNDVCTHYIGIDISSIATQLAFSQPGIEDICNIGYAAFITEDLYTISAGTSTQTPYNVAVAIMAGEGCVGGMSTDETGLSSDSGISKCNSSTDSNCIIANENGADDSINKFRDNNNSVDGTNCNGKGTDNNSTQDISHSTPNDDYLNPDSDSTRKTANSSSLVAAPLPPSYELSWEAVEKAFNNSYVIEGHGAAGRRACLKVRYLKKLKKRRIAYETGESVKVAKVRKENNSPNNNRQNIATTSTCPIATPTTNLSTNSRITTVSTTIPCITPSIPNPSATAKMASSSSTTRCSVLYDRALHRYDLILVNNGLDDIISRYIDDPSDIEQPIHTYVLHFLHIIAEILMPKGQALIIEPRHHRPELLIQISKALLDITSISRFLRIQYVKDYHTSTAILLCKTHSTYSPYLQIMGKTGGGALGSGVGKKSALGKENNDDDSISGNKSGCHDGTDYNNGGNPSKHNSASAFYPSNNESNTGSSSDSIGTSRSGSIDSTSSTTISNNNSTSTNPITFSNNNNNTNGGDSTCLYNSYMVEYLDNKEDIDSTVSLLAIARQTIKAYNLEILNIFNYYRYLYFLVYRFYYYYNSCSAGELPPSPSMHGSPSSCPTRPPSETITIHNHIILLNIYLYVSVYEHDLPSAHRALSHGANASGLHLQLAEDEGRRGGGGPEKNHSEAGDWWVDGFNRRMRDIEVIHGRMAIRSFNNDKKNGTSNNLTCNKYIYNDTTHRSGISNILALKIDEDNTKSSKAIATNYDIMINSTIRTVSSSMYHNYDIYNLNNTESNNNNNTYNEEVVPPTNNNSNEIINYNINTTNRSAKKTSRRLSIPLYTLTPFNPALIYRNVNKNPHFNSGKCDSSNSNYGCYNNGISSIDEDAKNHNLNDNDKNSIDSDNASYAESYNKDIIDGDNNNDGNSTVLPPSNNISPMHLAVLNMDIHMLELLLCYGGSLCVRDYRGRTPLELFIYHYFIYLYNKSNDDPYFCSNDTDYSKGSDAAGDNGACSNGGDYIHNNIGNLSTGITKDSSGATATTINTTTINTTTTITNAPTKCKAELITNYIFNHILSHYRCSISSGTVDANRDAIKFSHVVNNYILLISILQVLEILKMNVNYFANRGDSTIANSNSSETECEICKSTCSRSNCSSSERVDSLLTYLQKHTHEYIYKTFIWIQKEINDNYDNGDNGNSSKTNKINISNQFNKYSVSLPIRNPIALLKANGLLYAVQ